MTDDFLPGDEVKLSAEGIRVLKKFSRKNRHDETWRATVIGYKHGGIVVRRPGFEDREYAPQYLEHADD